MLLTVYGTEWPVSCWCAVKKLLTHSCCCVRQIKLSNPSSKPLIYQAIVSGRDARHFILPRGRLTTIAPRSSVSVTVEFRSRFMRACDAVLIMAGRRQGATAGCSLVFTLRASVDSITPTVSSSSSSSSIFITLTVRLLVVVFVRLVISSDAAGGEGVTHSLSAARNRLWVVAPSM